MAKNKSTVYLGYEDEEITGKQFLSSNLNKVGGVADWPSGDITVPSCPLCGNVRPLIVQLYAPLEQSQFHRTLYVFACLDPACSQNSKSWLCVRTQHLDIPSQAELINAVTSGSAKKKKNATKQAAASKVHWCSGADEWGAVDAEADASEELMDTAADVDYQQLNEENGNVIAENDNASCGGGGGGGGGGAKGISLAPHHSLDDDDYVDNDHAAEEDDEDDSNSMENDVICGFSKLEMHSPQNAAAAAEDPNANCAIGIAAAAANTIGGCDASATICAEIEDAETDLVLVESPKKPERDLIALLKHTPASAAIGPLAKITDVTLKSFYIAVDLEQRQHDHDGGYGGTLSADHIRELYQEYKRQDESALSPHSGSGGGGGADDVAGGAAGGGGGGDDHESYEKAYPAHGDLIFHQFLSTLQQNPGQILRYSRDTLPLLIAPLTEALARCQNCNGETVCEVQILSTLIPRLRLQQNGEPAPIEYGNVLVFTCLQSCWDTPDKMRYERIIVQAEK